ncbi:hypothetical protein CA603_43095 [Paraburkholderia hospita]|nr:hypothetical protein CA603_43095 [Paraburkholderia hospita]
MMAGMTMLIGEIPLKGSRQVTQLAEKLVLDFDERCALIGLIPRAADDQGSVGADTASLPTP